MRTVYVQCLLQRFENTSQGLASELHLEGHHQNSSGIYWTDLWSSNQRHAWHWIFYPAQNQRGSPSQISSHLKYDSQVLESRENRWETSCGSFTVLFPRQDHFGTRKHQGLFLRMHIIFSFQFHWGAVVPRSTAYLLDILDASVEPILHVWVPEATGIGQGRDKSCWPLASHSFMYSFAYSLSHPSPIYQ